MTAFVASLSLTSTVFANHPGENLDEVMASRETYFQPINIPSAPDFSLLNTNGDLRSLSDFEDKIVVLNFIFTNCTGVCPLHAARIKDIQEKINLTPMLDLVQFVSITTDPAKDSDTVRKEYAEIHDIDPINYTFLTSKSEDPKDLTRKLAAAYGIKFEPMDDGQQMHSVVTFIIDKGGRYAAKFHSLKFKSMNLVLYLNGLSNNSGQQHRPSSENWWDRVKSIFY